jgi:cytosine/adenosine deaminase-related metal-dependent hydrolase
VLITDEKGRVQEIVAARDAGDDILQFKGLLSPGFINCHCHLELSHMKGLLPEKTGLVDFVFNIVTQRHFPEENILQAIAGAEEEMISNGIVAVGDVCNNSVTFLQKLKQKLAYYNFIEISGWLPEMAAKKFQAGKNYYDEFCQLPSGKKQLSLAPHAPYSVSDELWELLKPWFQNKTTTIHNQETAFEDDLFRNVTGDFIRMYRRMKMDHSFFRPTGKSSLQSYLPKLGGAKNVLLVHNTFIKEEDITAVNLQSLQQGTQFFYCLCVRANNFIENSFPPIELLRQTKEKITIGTDSLASNRGLSILDEIKIIKKHFPIIPTFELLQWATINGAQALQMDNKLGSFEKNKEPGIVLIESLEEGEIAVTSTVKKIL